jgi:serine/threonine-protein kinase
VPSVIGQNADSARAHVQAAGYQPSSQVVASLRPQGIVVDQRPSANTSYTKGSIVVLEISLGPGSTSGQVPNVVNSSLSAAEHALRAAHFKVSTVRQSSTSVPRHHVISTTPSGGSTQPHASTVVVTYSSGPPPTPVPNVVGDTLQQAQFLLQQKNFVVDEKQRTSSQPVGTVLAQTPASGKAPQGSTVTLTVAKAPPDVKVPFLLGETAASAGARLGGVGLTPNETTIVKQVNPQYDGQVISQKPKAGKSVAPGSTVTIEIEQYQAPGGSTGPSGGTTGPTTGSTGVSSNGGTGSTAATGTT